MGRHILTRAEKVLWTWCVPPALPRLSTCVDRSGGADIREELALRRVFVGPQHGEPATREVGAVDGAEEHQALGARER